MIWFCTCGGSGIRVVNKIRWVARPQPPGVRIARLVVQKDDGEATGIERRASCPPQRRKMHAPGPASPATRVPHPAVCQCSSAGRTGVCCSRDGIRAQIEQFEPQRPAPATRSGFCVRWFTYMGSGTDSVEDLKMKMDGARSQQLDTIGRREGRSRGPASGRSTRRTDGAARPTANRKRRSRPRGGFFHDRQRPADSQPGSSWPPPALSGGDRPDCDAPAKSVVSIQQGHRALAAGTGLIARIVVPRPAGRPCGSGPSGEAGKIIRLRFGAPDGAVRSACGFWGSRPAPRPPGS